MSTQPLHSVNPEVSVQKLTLTRRIFNSDLFYQALTFLVFIAAWQIYATWWGGLLIPTFTETLAAFIDLLQTSQFWNAFYVSNQALVIGFLLSLIIGIPLGLVIGRFEILEKLSNVYLNIMLATPMAAIIPLLIMSVGFGLLSRVILVTLFSVVMVVVNVRSGVRLVDPSLIQMARSFGATERQIWRRILIPGAMPSIMTGVRIGLGRAVTGMVIVELLMVSLALGGLILEFRGMFNSAAQYGVIAAILLESLLLINAAQWLEKRLVKWSPRTTQGK